MNQRRHFFDDPRNLKRVLRVFYLLCAGLFLLDLVIHRHAVHRWEWLPGFHAIYGLVACVVLVLLAKALRRFVMRDGDYYEHD